jgi:calcium-dependent protein kinase
MASEIESLKAKVITPGKLVDLYDVKEVRGKGGFATVRAGVDKKTGKQVALKILNPKTFMTSVRQSRQVFQEIEILRNVQALKNDNILHFVAAHEDVSATTGLPRLTIVTSLCDGGELFDRIVSMGHYSEKQAAELIKKLACALKQLHTEAGIVHRDIKPENVLYASKAEDAEPVIADFGLSLIKGQEDLHSGLIGTREFLRLFPASAGGRACTNTSTSLPFRIFLRSQLPCPGVLHQQAIYGGL